MIFTFIGKTKKRLHDRKTAHFKSLTKNDHSSAIANHITATGHNIKWDHFEILASGKTCRLSLEDKRNIVYSRPKPAFNVNISNEKLMLY